MKNRIQKRYQLGLSMIELMIAIVIGLLLLAGTASLLISNKRIYKEQNEMGRLQENARFAMEMLIRDIRRAGYIGCMDRVSDLNSVVNGTSNDDFLLSMGNTLEGSENASDWYPSNSTEGTGDMLAGSDGISVKFFEPLGISIESEMPNPAADLNVTSIKGLAVGDIIALSDCASADIMQLTAVQSAPTRMQHNPGNTNPSPGNSTQVLSKAYSEDSEVTKLVSRRYFVGTNPVTGETSLYRYAQDRIDADADGNRDEFISQEVIEGVENMQILCGEDTAGNDKIADTYVTADAVANWDQVVSARISILMRTVKEDFSASMNTSTYNLMGTVIDPADDHRRRRVFTSTVQIRNQAF